MNLIYSLSSLLAKILIEEREKNTMPPDLAVSKNIVMPILFQVEGSTEMLGDSPQIILLRNILCNC